jgi:uncharacterized protein YdeI (YjbR/CyaY-like superfamily)
MARADSATFYPESRQAWREWLVANHQSEQSVLMICYKVKTGIPSISWSDAVDEALCFGWIDSTRTSLDADRFQQYFCKRKPRSIWSKINKDKVERLIAEGLMMPAGLACIEIAKQNGSWTILDVAEELHVPEDLAHEFDRYPGSESFYKSLSKSSRKSILQWIALAKRPETRQKRITEVAELAAQNRKPKQF